MKKQELAGLGEQGWGAHRRPGNGRRRRSSRQALKGCSFQGQNWGEGGSLGRLGTHFPFTNPGLGAEPTSTGRGQVELRLAPNRGAGWAVGCGAWSNQ
jgi:hypothetical protein